jgi:hypothetical protein
MPTSVLGRCNGRHKVVDFRGCSGRLASDGPVERYVFEESIALRLATTADTRRRLLEALLTKALAPDEERELEARNDRALMRRVRCQTDRIRKPGRNHPARAFASQIDASTVVIRMARRPAGAS